MDGLDLQLLSELPSLLVWMSEICSIFPRRGFCPAKFSRTLDTCPFPGIDEVMFEV
jgi:hypothetical protein